MKTVLLIWSLLALHLMAEKDTSTVLMFWNVENFFDWKADGTSRSEGEFSASGVRRWTKQRFYAKCNGIAKTILLAGDEFGELPSIIGLAEVENRFVLTQLIGATSLRKFDYGIVHYDSPDRRGIDCALLYRRTRWKCVSSRACHIFFAGAEKPLTSATATRGPAQKTASGASPPPAQIMKTRDILLAVLEPVGGQGEPLAVLVNHHSSKVGGNSSGRRDLAMARLLQIRDSLLAEGISRIIAVGDFNDAVISARGITEIGPLYGGGTAYGTIKFQGRWEKIDGCPVLEGLTAQEYIFDSPYLTEPDRSYSGTKPRRTYNGPRFLGGVSDHYPVVYMLKED